MLVLTVDEYRSRKLEGRGGRDAVASSSSLSEEEEGYSTRPMSSKVEPDDVVVISHVVFVCWFRSRREPKWRKVSIEMPRHHDAEQGRVRACRGKQCLPLDILSSLVCSSGL